MTSTEALHQSLNDMIAMINNGAETSANGLTMVEQLHRIDQIKSELSDEAPPMLMHFLEKRSYTKALDFLEGRDETVKPNC
jgi:hypothetical protein